MHFPVLKGKFVMSYNDCPEIRELYAGYNLVEVDRQDNLVTKTNPRRYRELIIKIINQSVGIIDRDRGEVIAKAEKPGLLQGRRTVQVRNEVS